MLITNKKYKGFAKGDKQSRIIGTSGPSAVRRLFGLQVVNEFLGLRDILPILFNIGVV